MASDEQAQGPTGKRLDAAVALAGSMGAGVAGLHVGGNVGAIMAASGGQAVSLFFDALRTRRKERAEQVFEDTLAETGLSTDELLSRLLMDDAHGELASRVLLAAQDAGTEEQLRALSRTLASGAMAEQAEGIGVELLFARALADLDSPHIYVLEIFTKTWKQLGLSETDTMPLDGLGASRSDSGIDIYTESKNLQAFFAGASLGAAALFIAGPLRAHLQLKALRGVSGSD